VIDHSFSRAPIERPGVIGYGSYKETLDFLESAVTRKPYILGEKFSAADVYISSQIGWGLMTKGIESRPAFVDYVARTSERPAFQRTIQQNNDLAAKLKAET
jgi:glutathione S-transferase